MKYKIVRDDISKFEADAIVLPSNPKLIEGSGSSSAIFERAGRKKLKKACSELVKKYGDIYVGSSMPTSGYDLEATFIIHTVVPKWVDGNHDEYELLGSAYYSALKEADLLSCHSVAIPLLGSGMNGFDIRVSFEIADKIITDYVPENKLQEVYLIVYGKKTMAMLRKMDRTVIENIDDSYVLTKDEQYRKPVEKAARYLKDIGELFVNDAIKMVTEMLGDPEYRKKLIAQGAAFAAMVIKAYFFGGQ